MNRFRKIEDVIKSADLRWDELTALEVKRQNATIISNIRAKLQVR